MRPEDIIAAKYLPTDQGNIAQMFRSLAAEVIALRQRLNQLDPLAKAPDHK